MANYLAYEPGWEVAGSMNRYSRSIAHTRVVDFEENSEPLRIPTEVAVRRSGHGSLSEASFSIQCSR